MMSLPDFREKQLLIVQASDVAQDRLQFKNENVCLRREDSVVNQLSCHKVFALFIVGDLSITSVLIRHCAEYGVSLFLLKDNLLPYASLVPNAAGNYLLRQEQYASTRDLDIARHIVANKILNQQLLLGAVSGKKQRDKVWQELLAETRQLASAKQLLGFEGAHSKDFFASYFGDMKWYRRLPRAKVDELNVLMDLGYTMLFNFMDALLGLYGFDAYKGVYHTLFFQRKSLVCDLMEPFRCIIDRQIKKAFNLGQISADDFLKQKDRYVLPYDRQKKCMIIFSEALMERKEELFCYVRDYYYCIMNGTDEFPVFSIQ